VATSNFASRTRKQQEDAIASAFRAYVVAVRSREAMARIEEFLAAGDLNGALGYLDLYIQRMANIVPQVLNSAGAAESRNLATRLVGPSSGVLGSFNPTYARAAELARTARLDLITRFTAQQRDAVRLALERGFTEGLGSRQLAALFRDSIGLTGPQQGAVSNFRRLLENQNAQALQRALRDRRFDSTVARAVSGGEPLTAKQIDLMVDRYRSRALDLRAETISRTEGTRLTSAARQEALEQTVEDLGVDLGAVVRVWNTTNDGRQRDAHDSMDGQEVGMDEPFEDGEGNEVFYPGDPSAPARTSINCRCTVSHEIRG